jgi:hypothetical protein
VDAGPRRPGQGHGPPQAVPQGRHAPLTRPVAAWDLAGWPRQRPIRGRVQGPGRGAGTAGEAVPDPTAPIPPGSSVPARSCLRSRGPCPNTFRAAAGNPAGVPRPIFTLWRRWSGKMAACLTPSLRSTWQPGRGREPSRGAVAAGRGGPAGQPGPARPGRSHRAAPQRRGRGAGGGRLRSGRAGP